MKKLAILSIIAIAACGGDVTAPKDNNTLPKCNFFELVSAHSYVTGQDTTFSWPHCQENK